MAGAESLRGEVADGERLVFEQLELDVEGRYRLSGESEVRELDTDEVELGLNVRAINWEHVAAIATSIWEEGQLQECTADTDENGNIRVWAGQHRYLAVQMINRYIEEKLPGEPRWKLRVRVYGREFTSNEVLEIQMAENLHNKMRPEEEAVAINKIWELYREVWGEKASMASLARKIGRGAEKVRNALRFVGMDVVVQELVKRDCLLYSTAVEISRLPIEKQFQIANKIILYNLTPAQSESLVKQTLAVDEAPFGLFGPEDAMMVARENHRLAIRNAADRAAQDAAGYFRRVLMLIHLMGNPEDLTMSDAVRDTLAQLVTAARYFEEQMGQTAPFILTKIERRAMEIVEK